MTYVPVGRQSQHSSQSWQKPRCKTMPSLPHLTQMILSPSAYSLGARARSAGGDAGWPGSIAFARSVTKTAVPHTASLRLLPPATAFGTWQPDHAQGRLASSARGVRRIAEHDSRLYLCLRMPEHVPVRHARAVENRPPGIGGYRYNRVLAGALGFVQAGVSRASHPPERIVASSRWQRGQSSITGRFSWRGAQR